eukprot:6070620-Ditylum_brightwellii.AAC.1
MVVKSNVMHQDSIKMILGWCQKPILHLPLGEEKRRTALQVLRMCIPASGTGTIMATNAIKTNANGVMRETLYR